VLVGAMIADQAVEPTSLFTWVQFGVTGLVIVAALSGWIWFRPAVEELQRTLTECRADLRQAREELKQQAELTREILVPAVVKSSELIQRVADEIWRLRGAA
jgi:hypothetical protein